MYYQKSITLQMYCIFREKQNLGQKYDFYHFRLLTKLPQIINHPIKYKIMKRQNSIPIQTS